MGGTMERARKQNCECCCPQGWLRGARFSLFHLLHQYPSADALTLSCRRGWFPFSYTRVLDNDGSERVHAR